MKPQRIQQLLREFEDVFASLAIVSVTLQDQTLADQVSEYASEHGGEAITEDSDGDGLYLEYQFEDITEAEEFHQFMIGSDWFGDEIMAVSLHTAEEDHIGDEDDLDMIPVDDDEDALGGQDDVEAHIKQQEKERDDFRTHYVPDVGGFDEGTNAFNAQSHGGDVVKNDYAMQVEELRRLSHVAAQMTLREFKEHRPIKKSSWNRKWKNEGSDSSAQSSSLPYHTTTRGTKKDPKVHRIRSTVAQNGSGWDMIQDSTDQDTDQDTDQRTDYKVAKQVDDFHARNRNVKLIPKQRDLREGSHESKPFTKKPHKYRGHIDKTPDVIDHKGWDDIQDSSSEDSNAAQTRRTREQAKAFLRHKHVPFAKDTDLHESLDETMDEMSTTAGIGGYTVPLGGKPANMKRNADVWRRNNQSKKPKANDTVKQNLAPTQSATSVKKDRKKAKAPYTSFADQSNIPFKHKSRKSKYGVSDSPASAIGGE